jgi:DNA polymerase epsilon subunit 2
VILGDAEITDAPGGKKGGWLGEVFRELAPRMRGGKVGEAPVTNELAIRTADAANGVVNGGRDEIKSLDPREHIRVIPAKEQPRLLYNPSKKHFEKVTTKPSLLPGPDAKTKLFRNRFHIIQQRVQRSSRQGAPALTGPPSLARSDTGSLTASKLHNITPIANLLGRSGSFHTLLGMLSISPTGQLTIADLTGAIALDLSTAEVYPPDGVFFLPGMIIQVDGMYSEDESGFQGLGGGGGVGGNVGGRFNATSASTPNPEPREVTLSIGEGEIEGAGFGWVDFGGVGSERESGQRGREMLDRILNSPIVAPSQTSQSMHIDSQLDSQSQLRSSPPPALIRQPSSPPTPERPRSTLALLGDLTLDTSSTLSALRAVLSHYDSAPISALPLSFILYGNFLSTPALTQNQNNSLAYKTAFDALAGILEQYPTVLSNCTFVFVPGDHDAWQSGFGRGAPGALPYDPVPHFFRTRVGKVLAQANKEAGKERPDGEKEGEAIWTSNPARLSVFGPACDVVLFRDDVSGRMRRHALKTGTRNVLPSFQADEDLAMTGGRGYEVTPSPEPEPMDEDSQAMPPPPPPRSAQATTEPQIDPDLHHARKLTRTLLDSGHLSPFPLQHRPVLWDYASCLQLYPLPTVLALCDADAAPFVVRYEGCSVMNCGRLVDGSKRRAQWCEWDVRTLEGRVVGAGF